MTLTFTVDRQSITRTDTQQAVANSVSYLRAQFAFLNDWDTAHILTPLFQNGTRVYTPELLDTGRYLDEDNACIVPQEVLAETGTLYVSIFDETDGVRITTDRAAVPIERSGYTPEAEETLTPTPSAYEQIMADYADFKQTGLKATDTDLTLEAGKLRLTAGGEAIGTGVTLPKTVTVSEFAPTEIEAITDGETFAGWGIRAGAYDAIAQTFAWEDTYARLPKLLEIAAVEAELGIAYPAAYSVNMVIPTDSGAGEGKYILMDKDVMESMFGSMDLPEQTSLDIVIGYYLFVPRQDASGVYDVYLFCGLNGSGLDSALKPLIKELYESFVYIVEHTYKAGIAFVPLEKEAEA